MFDLDVSKMIIVGIVAFAVIPPKDLPRVMRTVGQTSARCAAWRPSFRASSWRRCARLSEADLESVKKEFQAISDQAKIDTSFDPVGMMREDMTKAVEARGAPRKARSPTPLWPRLASPLSKTQRLL